VKEVREKKDKDKSRLRFWDMAGSKMGQITGLTGEEAAEAAKRAEEAVRNPVTAAFILYVCVADAAVVVAATAAAAGGVALQFSSMWHRACLLAEEVARLSACGSSCKPIVCSRCCLLS
jgi:hypothetical protein